MDRTRHYLTPLKRDNIPEWHWVFDTETKIVRKGGRGVHKWVVGACLLLRVHSGGVEVKRPEASHKTPGSLWQMMAGEGLPADEVVIWVHNLPFDLRISEAMRLLPQLGYELDSIVLERTAAWSSWVSGQGKLTICDLYSWLPVSLDRIASEAQLKRAPFDYGSATDFDLTLRCLSDVYVTSMAVYDVVTWLMDNEPGPFRPTGSGQSYAYWRRQYLESKCVLVHDDLAALAAEREAMHAGRAESWRHGLVKGPLYEYDLPLAYCRIAAECTQPTKLAYRLPSIDRERYLKLTESHHVLSLVEVQTDRPTVPARRGSEIIWPVGKFNTVLWDNEVFLARSEGATVEVGPSWVYHKGTPLKDVTRRLLAWVENPAPEVTRLVRIMLKNWARTLIGRCALRYRRWDDHGTLPFDGLSLESWHDIDTGESGELLHVGRRVLELSDMYDSPISTPQITSYIMAEARVRLYHLALSAGLGDVVYMDTDCVIVTAQGAKNLQRAIENDMAWGLVHKATWDSADIRGPRHISLDRTTRISGIPLKSMRIGDLTFEGETWAGIKRSMISHEPNTVAVDKRIFRAHGRDSRREHLPGGKTKPITLGGSNA